MFASIGNALNRTQRYHSGPDDHRARRHIIHGRRTTRWGAATDVTFNSGEVLPVKVTDLAALNERCTTSLADAGRRTILVAQSPGQVGLFASITPPTQAAMPAWNGEVIVTSGISGVRGYGSGHGDSLMGWRQWVRLSFWCAQGGSRPPDDRVRSAQRAGLRTAS